jgi:hypothetical protein
MPSVGSFGGAVLQPRSSPSADAGGNGGGATASGQGYLTDKETHTPRTLP